MSTRTIKSASQCPLYGGVVDLKICFDCNFFGEIIDYDKIDILEKITARLTRIDEMVENKSMTEKRANQERAKIEKERTEKVTDQLSSRAAIICSHPRTIQVINSTFIDAED